MILFIAIMCNNIALTCGYMHAKSTDSLGITIYIHWQPLLSIEMYCNSCSRDLLIEYKANQRLIQGGWGG